MAKIYPNACCLCCSQLSYHYWRRRFLHRNFTCCIFTSWWFVEHRQLCLLDGNIPDWFNIPDTDDSAGISAFAHIALHAGFAIYSSCMIIADSVFENSSLPPGFIILSSTNFIDSLFYQATIPVGRNWNTMANAIGLDEFLDKYHRVLKYFSNHFLPQAISCQGWKTFMFMQNVVWHFQISNSFYFLKLFDLCEIRKKLSLIDCS